MDNFKKLIRLGKDIITVEDASKVLNKNPKKVADDLARFAKQGKLLRIKRGKYVVVPLEVSDTEEAFDDPWLAASIIFPESYVGGWSALEYHNLTEQIFKDTCIISTITSLSRHKVLSYEYLYKKVPEKEFFGKEILWKKRTKLYVSDIHKTIIDILKYPELGGDIRHIVNSFENYLKSEQKDINLLIDYALRVSGGVLIKRLGFLLDLLLGDKNDFSKKLINAIKVSGYSKLDCRVPCDKAIAKWQLYVPKQIGYEVERISNDK